MNTGDKGNWYLKPRKAVKAMGQPVATFECWGEVERHWLQ